MSYLFLLILKQTIDFAQKTSALARLKKNEHDTITPNRRAP